MQKIINGIVYTYEKRNVGIGDKILDLNKDTIREAGYSDYDEIGNVIISESPVVEPAKMENKEIVGNYMIRSRTNEGFAAKVFWQVHKDGTVLIMKRLISKLPDTTGKILVRTHKDFFVYETIYSLKAKTILDIASTLVPDELLFTYQPDKT